MEKEKIIGEFEQYGSWLTELDTLDESGWRTPISEGKWSVGEVIAHIMKWDQHLMSIIPAVRKGEGMEFPEFDPFNKEASDYARSGISKSELLHEAKETREQLVCELNNLPSDVLAKPQTANGETHCPYTGSPYSLLYTIKEFTDHDSHHKQQIMRVMKENSLA